MTNEEAMAYFCGQLVTYKEKYKWHDLRKNPDDLPNYEDSVMVCVELYDEYVYTICMLDSEFWKMNKIIAWKCIEPFEEVE